jgi:hypothetical protein
MPRISRFTYFFQAESMKKSVDLPSFGRYLFLVAGFCNIFYSLAMPAFVVLSMNAEAQGGNFAGAPSARRARANER